MLGGTFTYLHLPVKNQPFIVGKYTTRSVPWILSCPTTQRNPLQPMLRLDPLQNGAILFHWQPRAEAKDAENKQTCYMVAQIC